MTYKQYSDHIKLCQYLGKEPEGEFKDFYDFITGLWDNMEFTVNDQRGINFHKDTSFYMREDLKNGVLRCERNRVCSFFENKKGMKPTETQDFIMSMVEQQLKNKTQTPMGKDVKVISPYDTVGLYHYTDND